MRARTILLAAAAACCLVGAHAASADATSWIVFSAEPGGSGTAAAQLFRVRTDGSELQQITTGARPATDPSFAPSGQQIVFVRLGLGIYRVNLDGTGLRRLTTGARDSFPVWSPKNSAIAFLRTYRGQWRTFLMSPAGKGQHPLRQAPPSGRPEWSKDGKSLLLPTAGTLATVDARTGKVRKQTLAVTELSTSQAATVSPNGKTIAFLARRPLTGPSDCGESPCPMFALYISTVGKTKRTRLVDDAGPAGWSPDGKSLLYVSKGKLTIRSFATGKTTPISSGAHTAAGDAPPAWSPR
jgi:Tol biopolymer transport system component